MRLFVAVLLSFGAGVLVTRWWLDDAPSRRTAERHEEDREALAYELERTRAELAQLKAAHANAPGLGAPGEAGESEGEVLAEGDSRSGNEGGSLRTRRFVDPATRDALMGVDWRPAGTAMRDLMPLLSEAHEVAHGKKKLRPELWGEILEAAGPVISVAVRVETSGVSWSYPTVQLNLMAATLASAGEPVTEAQFAALESIGRAFVEADERRRSAYGEEVCALRKRVDKSRQVGDLYAGAEPILNHEQRAVLWPAGVRGIVGLDLFSAASGWDEHVKHLPHKGRESLRKSATDGLMAHLALPAEQRGLVEHWVAEWESAFPDSYLLRKPSEQERVNVDMSRTERVLIAAEAQARLYESLMAHVPMSASAKKKIREVDVAFVPLWGE
jgi:hypothetical protein